MQFYISYYGVTLDMQANILIKKFFIFILSSIGYFFILNGNTFKFIEVYFVTSKCSY